MSSIGRGRSGGGAEDASKGNNKGRGEAPRGKSSPRGRGVSPAARPSILEGLPPDPFKDGVKMPSDLIANLTSSSDEDDLNSPPHPAPDRQPANKKGAGARSKGSSLPEPEDEDEVTASMNVCTQRASTRSCEPEDVGAGLADGVGLCGRALGVNHVWRLWWPWRMQDSVGAQSVRAAQLGVLACKIVGCLWVA